MSSPIFDLVEEMSDRMSEIVGTMELVSTKEIGLDPRAGRVYVSREGIVVRNGNRSTLDYYGGFEYVDKEFVCTIGDYTFYSREDDRVYDAIDYYMNESPLEEEVEE